MPSPGIQKCTFLELSLLRRKVNGLGVRKDFQEVVKLVWIRKRLPYYNLGHSRQMSGLRLWGRGSQVLAGWPDSHDDP